jgi:hypothetical protein
VLSSEEEWNREALECPGMNHGKHHSAREIRSALTKREREILISPTR